MKNRNLYQLNLILIDYIESLLEKNPSHTKFYFETSQINSINDLVIFKSHLTYLGFDVKVNQLEDGSFSVSGDKNSTDNENSAMDEFINKQIEIANRAEAQIIRSILPPNLKDTIF